MTHSVAYLTAAELELRRLEITIARLRSPWAISWHALERYIERFCQDLSYEDAGEVLAALCRGASYTGRQAPRGGDVWENGQVCLVVAPASFESERLALVTVYGKGEVASVRESQLSRPHPGALRGRCKGERIAREREVVRSQEAEAGREVRDAVEDTAE